MSFKEIALNVHNTVNTIAGVYETFDEPKYKGEAGVLRRIAKEGFLLAGETVSLIEIVPEGADRSGLWVSNLATMLGFSFQGISIRRLSIMEGVEVGHCSPEFPYRATLVEGFIDDENMRWNSFTLKRVV